MPAGCPSALAFGDSCIVGSTNCSTRCSVSGKQTACPNGKCERLRACSVLATYMISACPVNIAGTAWHGTLMNLKYDMQRRLLLLQPFSGHTMHSGHLPLRRWIHMYRHQLRWAFAILESVTTPNLSTRCTASGQDGMAPAINLLLQFARQTFPAAASATRAALPRARLD